MCGFVGIFDEKLSQEKLQKVLIDSTNTIIHRGPDSSGIKTWDGIGLGFRRLSIIDLSTAGDQPMCDETGNLWIVMNGEIYNYVELRIELQKKGCQFKSKSDTEVLLKCYQQYGVKALNMLRGMFAFIIWDLEKQELIIARDRFGEKPLYWSYRGGSLYLASEMKALFNYDNIDFSWNATALNAYLHLGYIPAPFSIYNGIRKLAPAEYMVFKKNNSGQYDIIENDFYWKLSVPANNYSISYNEAKEQATELLKESVRMQLRSDVPLGAFLSGGIDSSTVISIMKMCGVTDIKAFSIGFEESEFNELPYAKLIAQKLGVEHHTQIITENSVNELEKIFNFYDEPFADDSSIPTYFVSKLAREFVTVSLSGDGGDELFCGYSQYTRIGKANNLYKVPVGIRSFISTIGSSFIEKNKPGGSFIRYIKFNPNQKFLSLISKDSGLEYLSPEFLDWVIGKKENYEWRNMFLCPPSINGGQYIDQKFYLADDILTKVDRSSMAVSLESRVPLLDYKFAEFINSLPTHFKYKNNTQKFLLKDLVKDFIPVQVINRSKKGFAVPLKKWLAKPLLDSTIEKLGNCKSVINKNKIDSIRNNLVNSHSDNSNEIWKLLSLIHFWGKR